LVPPGELDFARAVAAIPGTELVSGPTGRSWVLGGHARGFTDELVVLRIPEDIACGPTQFYLWAAGDHVRTASARGSTITVSIIDPPDWLAGPPVFVEAETYKGVSPELEQEVQQIIDSLRQQGGIG
jgi:hypothetical protein